MKMLITRIFAVAVVLVLTAIDLCNYARTTEC